MTKSGLTMAVTLKRLVVLPIFAWPVGIPARGGHFMGSLREWLPIGYPMGT